MAPKVTSSSNRSKRRARKPVTTTKGRANRQSASKAQVTQGGTRGSGQPRVTNAAQRTRSRSSPVTGSGTKPSRPALPPARQTAAPKPKTPARPSIGNVSGPASSPKRPTASKPTGPVRPSIGNVSGPASSPKRPTAPPAPRPSTGAGVNAAVRTGAKGLSRVPGVVGKGAGILLGALSVADSVRGLGSTYNRATQRLRERFARKPRNRPSGDAVRNGSFIGGDDTRATSAASRRSGGRGVSPGSVKGKGTPSTPNRPSAAPARPSRTSGGTNPPSSGSSRPAGAQSSGSARPSSSASSRPSSPAQKPQAKASAAKAKSGAYGKDGKQLYMANKKNNPLMARTFGYQTGEGKSSTPRSGGKAASAGSKSEPVTKQAGKEQSILEEIKRKKREQQK